MTSEYRRFLIYLLLVTAIVLASGLGLRDPWPADEPRFALIARDMVESGNWLFPRVGGVIYPDKPPLFFWLVAALYALTDSLRLAFLLPGILAGLGTMLLVTDLARRLWGAQTAIWCGATLLAIVQFPLQMKSGQIDGLLCVWTTLGVYGFSRHLLLGPDWRWYAIGGLAAGLGVITKGVGVLPYLIFVPYAFAVAQRWPVYRHTWRDWRWATAPLATLLAVALWLVPMLLATTGGADPELVAYRDNILFHQTITRYTDSWGHIKPFWYLFTNAAPWLWIPVTFVLPWLVPAWRQDLRARNAAVLLLLGWLLLVLIFFSFSDGKRSLYIFPAAPALALVAGRHAEALLARIGVQRVLLVFLAVLSAGLIAVAMYALMNPHVIEAWATDGITTLKAGSALLGVGLLMAITILIFRRRQVLAGYATAMVVFWLGLSMLVAPSLDATRSGRALVHRIESSIMPGTEMGFVGWPEQFLLQWDKPVVHFGYRRGDRDAETIDAARWLMASPDRSIVLPESWLQPCFDPDAAIAIGRAHRRNWMIADRESLSASCLDRASGAPELAVSYSRQALRRDRSEIHAALSTIGVPYW